MPQQEPPSGWKTYRRDAPGVPAPPQSSPPQASGAGVPQPGATGYPYTGGAGALPARTGTIASAIGFTACLPIPILNMLVSGLCQVLVGRAQNQHGGVAAGNGARAANWGLVQFASALS